jgi:8-oxo-dGTP pyrophosphatase MutT (NUDIX family)
MVAVLRRNDRWWIPLTLRPSHLSHHGGQICLPGGRLEPGENAADAAQREFTEELGVDCEIRRPCGMLSEQFVFASNNRVQPIVAILEDSKYKWNPDPAEVSQVIEMPLAGLLDPKNRTTMFREKPVRKDDMTVDRISFRAPAFWTGAAVRHWTSDVGGAESSIAPITSLSSRLIWGATAIMLDEMVQMLQ